MRARDDPPLESPLPRPGWVYARTLDAEHAVAQPAHRLSADARRLLLALDGRRALSEVPVVVALPAELPARVQALEHAGLVVLQSFGADGPLPGTLTPQQRLARIKRAVDGAVLEMLGAQASVLEARLQDCLDLGVMRQVVRDVLERIRRRGAPEAADELARLIRDSGPL